MACAATVDFISYLSKSVNIYRLIYSLLSAVSFKIVLAHLCLLISKSKNQALVEYLNNTIYKEQKTSIRKKSRDVE